MQGNGRVLGLVAATIFVMLALAPGVRADTGKPSWSTGDFWEYAITEPLGGTTVTGTARTEVLGTDSVSIGTDSYASYKVKATISVTQGSTTVTTSATMWNRQSDLSIVKIEYTYQDPFTGNQITAGVSFSPPLEMQWPLVPGKTWTSATTVISSPSGGSTPGSAAFQVQSNQQITVPAGTFDATPLRVSGTTVGTGYTLFYFSGTVGNPVRMQGFDSNNAEQGKAELTKYNYAAGSFGAFLLIIIIAIVIVALIAAGLMMRRRRKPSGMPPAVPGQAWQQPPPGWQQQPPQPPQQPWQPPPQTPP